MPKTQFWVLDAVSRTFLKNRSKQKSIFKIHLPRTKYRRKIGVPRGASEPSLRLKGEEGWSGPPGGSDHPPPCKTTAHLVLCPPPNRNINISQQKSPSIGHAGQHMCSRTLPRGMDPDNCTHLMTGVSASGCQGAMGNMQRKREVWVSESRFGHLQIQTKKIPTLEHFLESFCCANLSHPIDSPNHFTLFQDVSWQLWVFWAEIGFCFGCTLGFFFWQFQTIFGRLGVYPLPPPSALQPSPATHTCKVFQIS